MDGRYIYIMKITNKEQIEALKFVKKVCKKKNHLFNVVHITNNFIECVDVCRVHRFNIDMGIEEGCYTIAILTKECFLLNKEDTGDIKFPECDKFFKHKKVEHRKFTQEELFYKEIVVQMPCNYAMNYKYFQDVEKFCQRYTILTNNSVYFVDNDGYMEAVVMPIRERHE